MTDLLTYKEYVSDITDFDDTHTIRCIEHIFYELEHVNHYRDAALFNLDFWRNFIFHMARKRTVSIITCVDNLRATEDIRTIVEPFIVEAAKTDSCFSKLPMGKRYRRSSLADMSNNDMRDLDAEYVFYIHEGYEQYVSFFTRKGSSSERVKIISVRLS